MSETDISTAAVERLLDGVTAGPWHYEPTTFTAAWGPDGSLVHYTQNTTTQSPHNARFIAASRDLVPALLADRDRLAAEVARLTEALAYYRDTCCEGFCEEFPDGFTNLEVERVCSGCKARAILTAHAARREGGA